MKMLIVCLAAVGTAVLLIAIRQGLRTFRRDARSKGYPWLGGPR